MWPLSSVVTIDTKLSMNKSCRVLAKGGPPVVSPSYRPLADYGEVPHTTSIIGRSADDRWKRRPKHLSGFSYRYLTLALLSELSLYYYKLTTLNSSTLN